MSGSGSGRRGRWVEKGGDEDGGREWRWVGEIRGLVLVERDEGGCMLGGQEKTICGGDVYCRGNG